MNKNFWLLIGLMVATSAVAQSTPTTPNTPAPAVPAPVIAPAAGVPAAATNAPAKKKKAVVKHKKAVAAESAAKTALKEPAVTLVPGPAEVAVECVNVRGQAGLKGEFIAQLGEGASVMVLSQINLDKHQADEPAQWAKIAFPTNAVMGTGWSSACAESFAEYAKAASTTSAHVWVFSSFIDASTKTVTARKLNLRAGPGENYSVLGVIERGTVVNPVAVKGDWTQIDPPATAYAFIAAMYLKQEASGSLAANPAPSTETQPAPAPTPAPETQPAPVPAPTPTPAPETQPVPTPVPEPQIIAATPTNPPAAPVPVTPVPETPAVAPAVPETKPVAAISADTNTPAPTLPNATALTGASVEITNVQPRIVTHEGVVRHVLSVIEPTEYEIYDPGSGVAIDYLYTTKADLNLGVYKGLHIVVTGEEKLSQRWHHTPVLTIQRIEVVK